MLKHPAASTRIDLVVIYLPLRVLLCSTSGIGKFMKVVFLIWEVYLLPCLADFISENFVPTFLFLTSWYMKKAAKWVYANASFPTTEYVLQSLSQNLSCHKVQATFALNLFLFWRCNVSVRKLRKKTCRRKNKKSCTLWMLYFTSGLKIILRFKVRNSRTKMSLLIHYCFLTDQFAFTSIDACLHT